MEKDIVYLLEEKKMLMVDILIREKDNYLPFEEEKGITGRQNKHKFRRL
ncbi:MAG: hypothetical protein IJW63_11810 [Lachnospiraceae bacterium]|nr:hypothetical protein [Lachnospiraceae bacterium]